MLGLRTRGSAGSDTRATRLMEPLGTPRNLRRKTRDEKIVRKIGVINSLEVYNFRRSCGLGLRASERPRGEREGGSEGLGEEEEELVKARRVL